MTSKSDGGYDYSSIPESSWTVCERGDDYVISATTVSIDGMPVRAERTQYLADEMLQAANRQEYNDSEGRRWGDGKVVARVPLNVIFSGNHELAENIRNGDRDHMKHWLNSEAALPFRTWKGKV